MEDEKKTKKQLIEELNKLRLEQIEQTRITSDTFSKAFLQNAIPTVITSVKNGRLVKVNDAFIRTVGLKQHEVIGRTIVECGFITKAKRADYLNELNKSGRIENFEMEIRPSDGTLRYGLFNTVMVSIDNENCLLTTIQDITDRKIADLKLLESEEKYRLLFNSGGDAIFIHDEEGRILAVNQQACEQFGYTHAELISMTVSQMDSPAEVQNIPRRIVRVIDQGFLTFEIVHQRKDGSLIQNEVKSRRISFDAKPAIMSICRDITDRKRAESELRNSEERFRLLFDKSPDAIAVNLSDKDGLPTNFVQVNDAACKMLGYTMEEILKLSPLDIDAQATSEQTPAAVGELLKNNYVYFETEMKAKNGRRIPVDVSATVFQMDNNQATMSVARNITDRKLAEEALVKSEERYRNLSTSSLDAIITENLDGIITFANPAAQNLAAGMDLVGMSVKEFIPPELISKYNEMMEARRQGYLENISYEWSMISPKEGSLVVFDIRSSILMNKSNPSEILIVARDITERKRAEEELAKSQAKYRVITENMMDCIFLIDANGAFQYATNCKDILGYELEDLIGITGMSITHPEELERIQRIYEGGVDGNWKEITYQTRLRHKEGHYVPMEIRGRTFADPSGGITGAVFAGREIISDQQNKQKRRKSKKTASTQPDLNSREKEILQWLMQGKSTWDISKILDIGEPTIKYHVDKIMKKLSAVNRTHAVVIAMQNELLN